MRLIIGGYAQGKLSYVRKENTENVYENRKCLSIKISILSLLY